jgi:HAE1 family hydrophobic/amphiphilic exporter-1
MRLPEFGVKKPVTVLMIFIAMIILGLVALPRLGLDFMPEIEVPAISVVTVYQGAAPEEIENKITEVLEDSLSTVSSLDKIESISKEDLSTITLKFDWGTDLGAAANDVREKIDLAKRYLPDEADDPIIFKFDLSMIPIIIFAVTARESYPVLYDLIDEEICDPIKTIPGVATASIMGGLEREILVELDRDRLKAYHLSTSQIVNIIRAENLSQPGGHLKIGQKDYIIRIPEELKVPEIEKIVVSVSPEGVPLYLKDVATIKDSFKEKTNEIEVNGRQGLVMVVQKQSGANTVAVARRVLRKIEVLKKNLPSDVDIVIARDFSDFIKISLGNLKTSLFWGAFFVIVVILFFLRNLRASFIVACSIPTSLIITFFLLYMKGYTLNFISLSSLAVAMGMVVDCTIVILDNIYRHRQLGHRPGEAAVFGASEVGKAVIASTLTTVAIFVPIVFVGGISGIMFSQMAYCICLALIASLFTALVLIPMLSSKFLLVVRTDQKGWMPLRGFYKKSEKWFVKIEEIYRNLLDWALSHRRRVILWTLVILVLSMLLVPFVETRFMAETDMGLLTVNLELPVGARMEETGKIARKIEGIIDREVPEKQTVFAYWGYSGSSGASLMGMETGSNMGMVRARLSYRKERKRSILEIADQLRPLTSSFPGAKVRYVTEDPLSGMLFGGGKAFTLEIYGHDLAASTKFAEQVSQELSKIEGLTDIEISRKQRKPELQVIVDRDKASNLGLNVADVGGTVETLFSGKTATKYREKGKEYDILVKLREEDRDKISDLENSFLTTPTGRQVRLSNVAQIEEKLGPVKIERKDQQRIVRVMANVSGRGLGAIVSQAKGVLSNIRPPEGFFINFGGEREEQEEAFAVLTIALLLGMVLVYMVMASQFESLRDPFIILFSIPFGMIGVIWSLFITREVFSVDTFIGLILLVGIVVNNGIVLISYINILRKKGLSVREAVTEGGRARLRPVLMTAITTIFALMPLALSTGEGHEFWRPFGIAIIGGLLISTLITLVFVPTLYSIFEERKRA